MKIPMAEPGSSKKNKTGGWRILRPVVDEKKCTKCGLCALYCPDCCIEVVGPDSRRKYPEFDYGYCKGCAICEAECPVEAIKMVKEKAGGE